MIEKIIWQLRFYEHTNEREPNRNITVTGRYQNGRLVHGVAETAPTGTGTGPGTDTGTDSGTGSEGIAVGIGSDHRVLTGIG